MITLAAWAFAVVLALPLLIYAAEVAIGLPHSEKSSPTGDGSVAVLIPAHDEALGIGATVVALIAVAPPGCRIVVVADNCSDDTAAIARTLGIFVIERNDPTRRGKGFALDFGRAFLAQDPPDAVIILDADCRVRPGSIERLAAVACLTGQPAQGVNTLEPDLTASPLMQISSFSFLVKNLLRARGIARTGGVTLLTGTGMAFPWQLFRSAPLATPEVVEDLALGVDLALRGYRTRLVPDAGVTSPSAQQADLLKQRARWEGGFIGVARRSALPLLAHGLSARSRACVALGLHLLVPPLAMLLAGSVAGLALVAGLAVAGASALPAVMLALALALALGATVAAWLAVGRDTLSLRSALIAPFYVLWKIPMYFSLLRPGSPGWQRTPRRVIVQGPDDADSDRAR